MNVPFGFGFDIVNHPYQQFYYSSSFAFYTPKGNTAEFKPGTQFLDDIDLNIRPWSWWVVLDNITEISCIYNGSEGATIVEIFDGRVGSSIKMPLSDDDAKTLYTNILGTVSDMKEKSAELHKNHPKWSSLLSKGPDCYIGRKSSILRYPVQSNIHTVVCSRKDFKNIIVESMNSKRKTLKRSKH
jgi:hypothetical protein